MANGQDFLSRGSLQIQVINIRNNFPIQNARVSISSKGEPERVLEQLTTDASGQTENISLPAPLRNTAWSQISTSLIRNMMYWWKQKALNH